MNAHAMNRPLLLLTLCFAAASSLGADEPNILLIVADDAGYADFGFQHGGIDGDFADLTPHLDRLATNGVRFSSGYVTGPICCPSRAGMITGRYQQRFGFENNIQTFVNAGLPASESTIADHLKTLGYHTYAIGKWHLGADLPEQHPNQVGFDEFTGFLGGARTYFQYTGTNTETRLQHNGSPLNEPPNLYLTDVFGKIATNCIASHTTNYPGEPFFMYLAFNAVHKPLDADDVRLADPRIQDISHSNRLTLAAMTIALDDAVGLVTNKLEELGMRTNTLVAFINDNGGPEDKEELNAPNWSDNGPLREGKTTLYEGGIRVPFVLNWPGTIATNQQNQVIDDPVISLDLLPTFIAAAGGRLFPDVVTDGVNLLPRVLGITTNPIERCLFWRLSGTVDGYSAVRKRDWKWYRGTNNVPELYDLAVDLGESNNLAGVFPDKEAELAAEYAEWERGVIEPLWGAGAPVRSTSNLQFGASALGYGLEKTNTGFGFMSYELRTPLSLRNDWSLVWSMKSADVPGYERNGYIVLADDPPSSAGSPTGDVIRAGFDFSGGMMSIYESQLADGASQVIPVVPADETFDFRVEYVAATGTLTLRYGATTLSRVLAGSYGDFTHAGYALQSSARTLTSAILRYLPPRAPGRSPSWTRLQSSSDYTPGTYDVNTNFMGGTEAMSLVVHKDRLYAGIGYWNDIYNRDGGSVDPFPGAQVLVKDAAGSPWRQDHAFGEDYLRVESLRSLTLTTDKTGQALNPHETLLIAGMSPPQNFPGTNAYVFVRNDDTGEWMQTSPGSVTSGFPVVRFVFDHVDRESGTHHIFCARGSEAEIIRGGYNAATGLIDWEPTPELKGPTRMLSAGECNGWLYACYGGYESPSDDLGGVFWREDGANAQWHLLHEFPLNPDKFHQDIRGFTAVAHPKGFGYDVALVALNSLSKIARIDPYGGDPRNGHLVTEEIEIQQFLGDHWNNGAPLPDNTIPAYNDMPELTDPATCEPVRIIGMWIKQHPDGTNSPAGASSWYLIRRPNATFEWGQVIDPTLPVPVPGLRGCRAARLSPFQEDGGRVLFLSGFDAATPFTNHHNTAWIYRAELAGDQALIRHDGTNPVVGIDTAYGWNYQLEEAPELSEFQSVGAPLPGSNAVQEVWINAPADHRSYRWNISR
jgi:arylsulfatase A-like enzyme